MTLTLDRLEDPNNNSANGTANKDKITDLHNLKQKLTQKEHGLDTLTIGTKENNQLKDSINRNITIIDNYGETLEAGSFEYKSSDFEYLNKLEKLTGRTVSILYKDLYYFVYISSFDNRKMALQRL